MYHTSAMKITLYRSILREIMTPLLLGVITFTFLLIMGRMVKLTDLVIAKGVPLEDVLRLVAYLLPSFAAITLPMALLLAVLLAFGRLSSDSETTAMKACGVSLYGMLPPVMITALTVTITTAFITIYLLPTANFNFRHMLYDIIGTRASVAIKEKVFNDSFPNLTIYTDTYDQNSRILGGVLVNDERDKDAPLTIFARKGILSSDLSQHNLSIRLEDGTIHQRNQRGDYRLVSFGSYTLTVNIESSPKLRSPKEDQLTLTELKQKFSSSQTPLKVRRLQEVEYYSRFSQPVACLVFALIGVPLGMQNRRSGRSGGFALAIVVIVFYYILFTTGRNLAAQGSLPAIPAIWMPNIVFLILGGIMFRFAATERPIPFISSSHPLFLGRLIRLGQRVKP